MLLRSVEKSSTRVHFLKIVVVINASQAVEAMENGIESFECKTQPSLHEHHGHLRISMTLPRLKKNTNSTCSSSYFLDTSRLISHNLETHIQPIMTITKSYVRPSYISHITIRILLQ